MHDAVDHNAVVLGEVMTRPSGLDQKLGEVASAFVQLGVDAKNNDERLDAQLCAELNAVTSRLGDELRAENVKMGAAFEALKVVALGAAAAARAAQAKPGDPPGFASLATIEPTLAQLDACTTAIATQVESMSSEFSLSRVQVEKLTSRRQTLASTAVPLRVQAGRMPPKDRTPARLGATATGHLEAAMP